MNFKPIDKKKSTEKITLYLTPFIEVKGVFTIKKREVTKLEIEAKDKDSNNILQLESAHFCCEIIKNSSVYYLIINLKKLKVGTSTSHKKVNVNLKNCTRKFKIASGIIIFNHINKYVKASNEIKDCSFDIFDSSFNPDTSKGNIIIGNP